MAGEPLRKYISALAVALILIGAPLGSYFYLRSGFEYRVQYLEELEPKDSIPLVVGQDNFIRKTNGKVRLIHRPGSSLQEELEILTAIDKQIVDKTFFSAITLDTSGLGDDGDIKSVNVSSARENLKSAFTLIDTSGIVRHEYSVDADTKKDIIKHLSVLIPMPKHTEVVLKRTINEDTNVD